MDNLNNLPHANMLQESLQESALVETIKAAAKRGHKGITYTKVSDNIVKQLENKGYKVHFFGVQMCSIEWD